MTDYSAARKAMVDNQVNTSSVTDGRLLAVLSRIPREIFVPADRQALAYSDAQHVLGDGRFLPAPATFARLIQLAEITPEDRILDYWPGSGYSAAVLAALGRDVVVVEPVPTLAETCRSRLGDLGIRYGYQRFETNVMIAVVAVLIVLVCGIQWLGDRLVAKLDHR